MTYKPYSLYQYGQLDGRVTFAHIPRRDMLLVNVKQMALYYNPSARCNLVVMSFEPNSRISFDARYMVPPFDDIIAEGKPFIVGIQNGLVEIEPLDPNRFFCKY